MVLVMDVSASSAFGSSRRTKREFATEIAATLANSAARSSDKVALLLFSDQVELFLPPRKGRRHILRLIREMLSLTPKHRGTNIPAALAFLNHVLHSRSIIFLLTDFLHSFGAGNRPARCPPRYPPGDRPHQRPPRRGLSPPADPRESILPPAGLLTVEDAETGELVELDSSRAAVRERFAQINAERLAEAGPCPPARRSRNLALQHRGSLRPNIATLF